MSNTVIEKRRTLDCRYLEYLISRTFGYIELFPGPLGITHSCEPKPSLYLKPQYLELFGTSNNIFDLLANFLSLSRTQKF